MENVIFKNILLKDFIKTVVLFLKMHYYNCNDHAALCQVVNNTNLSAVRICME